MNKVTFSIEFAHIYTNEAFSTEHKRSIEKLKKYLPTVSDQEYQTCLMIDNYNSTEDLLDIPEFISLLSKEGVKPDYYALEADMKKYSHDMLEITTNNHMRKSYEKYIDGNGGKLPCSFMTAIWYLIRLGYFKPDKIVKMQNDQKFKPAESLINILPERFRIVESKTLKLIGSGKYSDAVSRIDYVFFGDNGHI